MHRNGYLLAYVYEGKKKIDSLLSNLICTSLVPRPEETPHMSMFANNALLGGGVRVRVWIREQKKIKRRSKEILSF